MLSNSQKHWKYFFDLISTYSRAFFFFEHEEKKLWDLKFQLLFNCAKKLKK